MSWLQDSLWDFWRRGDKLLLGLCLAASGYGLLLIYSATRWNGNNRSVIVQALGIFLGVLVYIALSSVDMELFVEKRWKWILAFNLGFNLLVRVPGLGVQHGGNLSWIHIPGIPLEIQPAEVVKLSFILLFAFQCAKLREKDLSSIPSVAQLVGHLGLTAGVSSPGPPGTSAWCWSTCSSSSS